ncbi:MAG: sugar kinase [Aliiglaciecola sp.]
MSNPSLLAIGECLVEMVVQTDGRIKTSFAGDTYNALVYAKRWCSDLAAHFCTATGEDTFSIQMRREWQKHGIANDFALSTPSFNAGLYLIETDAEGDRRFVYWRNQSAATQMIKLGVGDSDFLPKVDIIFFSGIGLGILDDTDKTRLLKNLEKVKQKGVKVAFDPNYRPTLWKDANEAQIWIEKAYAISDIVLPGMDDHLDIFGHKTVEEVRLTMEACNVTEYVIKAGKHGVYGFYNGTETFHNPFKPARQQLDSTAAGDSFAGIYLVNRINGIKMDKAAIHAADVAGLVVQHSGAIVDKQVFDEFMQSCDGGEL